MNKKIIPLALAGMLGIVTAGSALGKMCEATLLNYTFMDTEAELQLSYQTDPKQPKDVKVMYCDYKGKTTPTQHMLQWIILSNNPSQCPQVLDTSGNNWEVNVPVTTGTQSEYNLVYIRLMSDQRYQHGDPKQVKFMVQPDILSSPLQFLVERTGNTGQKVHTRVSSLGPNGSVSATTNLYEIQLNCK